MYAGIDYSMTCPSIFIGSKKDFSQGKSFFFYLPKSKKDLVKGVYNGNIYGLDQDKTSWKSDIERFDVITDWALSILKMYKVDGICLEGYSMGSKGLIFNIAEHTGILKHKIHKELGVVPDTPAPTTVKKWFAEKGNAKKEEMYATFIERTGVDLEQALGKKAKDSPISDIVDAYAMFLYGLENYYL